MKTYSLSFTISETELAYAVFRSQKLVFWEAHAFLSGIDRVIQKAVGHVARCVERYQPKAVVLESLPENGRASPVALQVRDSLRRLAVPIFEVSEQELLRSFALPTLKNRQDLRTVLVSIFPHLQSSRFMHSCLDAAALRLHFETNRLLSA